MGNVTDMISAVRADAIAPVIITNAVGRVKSKPRRCKQLAPIISWHRGRSARDAVPAQRRNVLRRTRGEMDEATSGELQITGSVAADVPT
jgi:hypothetical protein